MIFSQSYEDLKNLESEYKKALELQSLQKPSDVSNAENLAKSTSLPNKIMYSRKEVESLLSSTQKLLEKLKFYEDTLKLLPYVGYDYFTIRDSIPFWQNIPISNQYSLGPGDEITISLWGETEVINSETINRDGQIFIENIGMINLGGKTLNESKSYILSKYSQVYSTLLGDNPKSFLDVSIGEIKSINVHFVGFVNIPGVHMIHPFSNIVSGLNQVGGVKNNGSLRDIQIIRNGKKIRSIDIYSYFFKGSSINDLRLMDQDIVFVPTRNTIIPLTGNIYNPGYYELLDNESVEDLLEYAGGKTPRGSETILIYKDSNSNVLSNSSSLSNIKISDGDSIHVPIKPIIEKFVYIEGQVKNAGKYPFELNMTLNDLLNATSTFNDSDFTKSIDLSKIIINKKNSKDINPLKIIVNLNEKNQILQNGDHITIPKINKYQKIESIKIFGEIMVPGIYPVNNLTNLSTILNLAGGYTKNALVDGIEIYRDSLQIAWVDQNFFLEEGDSLVVLKRSGLIKVLGEVNKPGYLNYKKNNSIKKYIKNSGGFSSFADSRDIYIIYPNGIAKPYSKWFSPKVVEGSIIVVNKKSLLSSKGPDGLEVFSIITTQATNIATTLLTLILLRNQT